MPIFPKPGNIVTGGIIQATDVGNLYDDINGQLDNVNIKTGGIIGANLASSTVAVGQIKTAVTSSGVSPTGLNHSNGLYLPLPSGAFTFFPGVSTDSNVNTRVSLGGWRNADGDAEYDIAKAQGLSYQLGSTTVNAIVWLAVLNPIVQGGSSVGTITLNYISASPPYDLGDGEIPLFVFLLVHPSGDIAGSWIAEDPPWAKNSKQYKMRLPHSIHDAIGDPTKLGAMIDALDQHHVNMANLETLKAQLMTAATPEMNTVIRQQIEALSDLIWDRTPMTQEQKNENMPSVPHPFVPNTELFPSHTAVMLDPMSDTMKRIRALHLSGENVNILLHHKVFDIGNTHVKGRSGPPGVMVVDHKFKNSTR